MSFLRSYSTKLRARSAAFSRPLEQPFIVDVPFDDPRFGQLPIDSPLLGPRPAKGSRKRRSPFWKPSPASAFYKQHFEGDQELQQLEQQRITELKIQVQQERQRLASALASGAGPNAATVLRKWTPQVSEPRIPASIKDDVAQADAAADKD